MNDPLVEKLIDPLIVGESFFETWKIASVEFPILDQPTVSIRIINDEGCGLKIVLTQSDPSIPCYERTPSFNIAFAKEKEAPLDKKEEEALVHVVEAVKMNDLGRFRIEIGGGGSPALTEDTPKPTLLTKMLDILFPPKKKSEGQPAASETAVEQVESGRETPTKDKTSE